MFHNVGKQTPSHTRHSWLCQGLAQGTHHQQQQKSKYLLTQPVEMESFLFWRKRNVLQVENNVDFSLFIKEGENESLRD